MLRHERTVLGVQYAEMALSHERPLQFLASVFDHLIVDRQLGRRRKKPPSPGAEYNYRRW